MSKASVPGGVPPDPVPTESLERRLEAAIERLIFGRWETLQLEKVLKYLRNRTVSIDREIIGDLRRMAEKGGLFSHHRQTVLEAADAVEKKANG
jgi:hypothetical protein